MGETQKALLVTLNREGRVAFVFAVILLAGCAGSGAQSDAESPTESSATTNATSAEGVPACWQTVSGEYKNASDQAVVILRDDFARLLGSHRAFTRALNDGDIGRAREALDSVIQQARSVTDASVKFDRVRRMAITAESQCEAEQSSGGDAVAECHKEAAQAYAVSAGQAHRALDKPMARVLFGLQEVIAAGNEGDVAGVYRGNRTLGDGLDRVIPRAGRFARLAGLASAKESQCAS